MKYSGTTTSGDGKGKEIGFATINVEIKNLLSLPERHGVYAVHVFLENIRYNGIAHIGPRPTLHKKELRIELHLFDFHETVLQNTPIMFEIIGEKIRDIWKFSSLEKLKLQIQQDCVLAQEILK